MTDALRKSIEKIRTLSPQLNAATDDANKVVQVVEKFLNEECQLGVPTWRGYEIDESRRDEYNEPFTSKLIGYDRVNGRFRIVIRENIPAVPADRDGDGAEPATTETYAWSDATRGDKLSSFQYLPSLLEMIANQVERHIKSASETSSAVKSILDAIGSKATPADPLPTPTLKQLGAAALEAGLVKPRDERPSSPSRRSHPL